MTIFFLKKKKNIHKIATIIRGVEKCVCSLWSTMIGANLLLRGAKRKCTSQAVGCRGISQCQTNMWIGSKRCHPNWGPQVLGDMFPSLNWCFWGYLVFLTHRQLDEKLAASEGKVILSHVNLVHTKLEDLRNISLLIKKPRKI